jgi:HTH-type transcriptional regulator, transcriptional repressor of NAD biosynthesis genes
MKHGLVLGKFMPLHKGHLALIQFAKNKCDVLTVLLCAEDTETIPASARLQWLQNELGTGFDIQLLLYDQNVLPNTSVSSRSVSLQWANRIKEKITGINMVFSSETYGLYLAEYLDAVPVMYDVARQHFPVSATQIRNNPFAYWDFIPETVKPYFVKKICILGTESTGKSTLTEKLARHFKTAFVPEMARDIIEQTEECTYKDLFDIAALHAKAITEKAGTADMFLFIDTDIHITKSYASFLFGKELPVAQWIEEANKADCYIFLEPDCPFVQDGTRLNETDRNRLSLSHKNELDKNNIHYIRAGGNWEERFDKVVKVITEKYLSVNA